jgi:hypothetical protein
VIDAAGPARSLATLIASSDPTGTGAAIGVGTFLLGIAAYMFKELRRKDDSVWRIIAEKDKEIVRLQKQVSTLESKVGKVTEERDFWRDRRLAESDEAYDAETRGRARGPEAGQ